MIKHGVSPYSIKCNLTLIKISISKAQKAATSSPINFGRIAKPLRGGGGAAPSAPTASGPSGGFSGSVNPLARVQNEDSGYVQYNNVSLFFASG